MDCSEWMTIIFPFRLLFSYLYFLALVILTTKNPCQSIHISRCPSVMQLIFQCLSIYIINFWWSRTKEIEKMDCSGWMTIIFSWNLFLPKKDLFQGFQTFFEKLTWKSYFNSRKLRKSPCQLTQYCIFFNISHFRLSKMIDISILSLIISFLQSASL